MAATGLMTTVPVTLVELGLDRNAVPTVWPSDMAAGRTGSDQHHARPGSPRSHASAGPSVMVIVAFTVKPADSW